MLVFQISDKRIWSVFSTRGTLKKKKDISNITESFLLLPTTNVKENKTKRNVKTKNFVWILKLK